MSRRFFTGIDGPPNNGDLLLQPQGGMVVVGSATKLPTFPVGITLQGLDEWDSGPAIQFLTGSTYIGGLSAGPSSMFLHGEPANQNSITTIDGTKELKLRTRPEGAAPDDAMVRITQTGVVSTLPVALPADPVQPLEAATKQYVDATASGGTVPWYPGDVKMIAYATPDPGWLLCDGAAVSRTEEAALFARIGTSYGVGDGTTTFNLPNFTGRAGVMRDAAAALFDTLGKTGGSRDAVVVSHSHDHTHTHVGAAHTHTINHDHAAATTSAAGAHNHVLNTDNAVGSFAGALARGTDPAAYTGTPASIDPAPDHTHSVNLASFAGSSGGASATTTGNPSVLATDVVGVSGTDANLPPFLVINYVIKT
jgi:microcystin-dependent protein